MLPRPCHCRRKPCHRRRQKHDSRPHSFLSQFSHCCRTLFFGRLFPTPLFFLSKFIASCDIAIIRSIVFLLLSELPPWSPISLRAQHNKKKQRVHSHVGRDGEGGQGGGGRGSTQHIVPHLNKPDLAVRPSRTFFRRRMYLSSGIFAGL